MLERAGERRRDARRSRRAGLGLAFSPDGATLYSGGLDSKIVIWDLIGDRRLGRPFAIPNEAETPRFALRHDGRDLAIGNDDGTVALIDARTLPVALALPRHPRRPGHGHRVRAPLEASSSSAAKRASSRYWIRAPGRTLKRLQGHRGPVVTPGFSADGRLMAALSDLNTVGVYALPSGRPISRTLRYTRDIADVSLSPDGRTVAITRPPDDTVEILDVPTLRHRTTLPGSESVWDYMRFTPDGRFSIGASWKGWVQLWSTDD